MTLMKVSLMKVKVNFPASQTLTLWLIPSWALHELTQLRQLQLRLRFAEKLLFCYYKKFGLHQISDILKRQKRQLQELHSARANNTRRHPCEDTGVRWPVRNATRYETRQRHSVQTETLKTEGQRRKVRKGIAAVVVGGIWLGWCMTASVKQGENLGRGSSGWLQGEVTERTQRALKLDRRTFWLGTYVLCIHDTLILKGRHECSNRVPFQCY